MKEVCIVQLIRTTLAVRGDGKDDPLRRVEQFWDFDGNLVWERDPINELEDRP